MQIDLPFVHVDNEHGGYLATRHLINLGHRNIAFAMVDSHPERSARWIGHRIAIREAERAGLQITSSVLLLTAGIKVPEEVSLVGCYNLLDGAQVSPSLTTIDQALSVQVQDAINVLKQEEEPSRSLEILTPPTLIQRESSAPPPTRSLNRQESKQN